MRFYVFLLLESQQMLSNHKKVFRRKFDSNTQIEKQKQ